MLWGETANKVTQGCLAGWWQVWDWTLLFCCSGGLRMKPGFVLVCWVCDHPACVNFTMALATAKNWVFVSLCMVIINVTTNYHWLGSSTALHWHGLKSWRHPYFQKTPAFSDSTTAARRSAGGEILHEWMCHLKMQRSLVLREEAHFQTGKWVHNILRKPLEVRVSSLQKLPCLHSSHSALVTICERHFKADFSKPGSACAFQTLLATPHLSRICC